SSSSGRAPADKVGSQSVPLGRSRPRRIQACVYTGLRRFQRAALGPVYFFPSVVTGTARWVVLLEALTSLSPLFTRASLLPAPVKQFYVVAFALMRIRALWQWQQRLFAHGKLAAQELAYLRTSAL